MSHINIGNTENLGVMAQDLASLASLSKGQSRSMSTLESGVDGYTLSQAQIDEQLPSIGMEDITTAYNLAMSTYADTTVIVRGGE